MHLLMHELNCYCMAMAALCALELLVQGLLYFIYFFLGFNDISLLLAIALCFPLSDTPSG